MKFMPTRSGRPCLTPGCRALARGGSRCELHAKDQRGSRSDRGYDNRWLAAAKNHLARHPMCVECDRAGRLTKATDVDHVRPHRGDAKLFWDSTNWQSLCHSCHAKKTASETGARNVSNLVSLERYPSIPVHVVCSPCAATARALVTKHMQANDVLIEVNSLAALLSGMPVYECHDEDVWRRALLSRNHTLRALGSVRLPWRRAFFITDAPKVSDRRHWRAGLRADVVVLEVPLDECLSTIHADAYGGKQWRSEAATRWWSSYVIDHLDATARTVAQADELIAAVVAARAVV